MKTMKQNWQRALATFTALLTIQTPSLVSGQDNSSPFVTPQPGASGAPANALPYAQNSPDQGLARRYGLPEGALMPAVNSGIPQSMAGTHGKSLKANSGKLFLIK